MNRIPWSREELNRLIPHVEKRLAEAEASQEEEVRPVGPLTHEEARDLLVRLADLALTRPLTLRECFMHGQLLAAYEQACYAKYLGLKGRFYVIPESKVQDMINQSKGVPQ